MYKSIWLSHETFFSFDICSALFSLYWYWILNSSSFHFSICVFFSLQHQNGFNSVRCSNLWVFSVFVCLCRLKPSFMAYILFFFFAVLFDGGYFGCTHMVYGFQLDCTQQKPYEIKSHAMFPNWITAISLVQLRRVTYIHARHSERAGSISWVKWPER